MPEAYNHHKNCQHKIEYRMSCDDFDVLYEVARGCCQICKTPEAETTRRQLVIDHLPGYPYIVVRGLLCDACNSLMGRYDAGKLLDWPRDERITRYISRAWFIRVLVWRRLNTYPPHVRLRYTAGYEPVDRPQPEPFEEAS
jgi:hypothetical protein